MQLSRSSMTYQRQMAPDDEIIAVLQELAERFPERGFGKYFQLIRRRGHTWNHKRVYRVYCGLKMNRRRIGKKRLSTREPQTLEIHREVNKSWSIDFMKDVIERIFACRGILTQIRMDNGSEFISATLSDATANGC